MGILMHRLARCLSVFTALVLTGLVLLPVKVSRVRAQPSPMLVIVSGVTGLKDISTAMLRRAFQSYPTEYEWGKRLIPLNHPVGSELRARFDSRVLGLESDAVGRFWIDRRVRGESEPPRTIPSASLAVRVVATLPGAITYVTPDLLGSHVHALTVDGKSHLDPGYAFAR